MGIGNNFLNKFKGKISGLLGAASTTGKVLLPINPLIKDYGIDVGKLFKVKMTAYQPQPIRFSPIKNGGKIENTANVKIAEMDILYSGDSFRVNHTHKWGDTGAETTIKKLSNTIGNVLPGGLAGIQKTAESIFSETPFGLETRRSAFGDVDVAPVYKGSGNQSIQVSFMLMAHSDPISEVVIPAQILTYLTYPKMNTDTDIYDLLMETVGQLNNASEGKLKAIYESITESLSGPKNNSVEKMIKHIQDKGNDISQNLKSQIASAFRYRVGIAPPIWRVSCSNGTQYLGNAHVESINVTYYGPWMGSTDSSVVDSAISLLTSGTNGVGDFANKIFPDANVFTDFSIADVFKDTNRGGYPSYATVDMKFRSNFDLIFGEEWLLSLSKDDKGNKISLLGF